MEIVYQQQNDKSTEFHRQCFDHNACDAFEMMGNQAYVAC